MMSGREQINRYVLALAGKHPEEMLDQVDEDLARVLEQLLVNTQQNKNTLLQYLFILEQELVNSQDELFVIIAPIIIQLDKDIQPGVTVTADTFEPLLKHVRNHLVHKHEKQQKKL